MLVSWFFYYKTSGSFLLLLAFITISDFLWAKLIYRASEKGTNGLKRLWLITSILIDLGLLAFFKYAYFSVDAFNQMFGTNLSITEKIILPVGISFYIFQVISYTTDVYRGQVRPVNNILDFGFYVSFFPQLVAGPIVRASEFMEQLYRPFRLSRRQAGLAVFWVLNGLAKKIILSDYLATHLVDRVFENPLLFSGFENLFALFAYSLQVYADFSGYTDIAIGVAMLMGFYLPKNFHSPYKARNPQEFWRRWHISLSRWLKTYLYIPLGGNRNTTTATWICIALFAFVALMLTGSKAVAIGLVIVGIIIALALWLLPQQRKLLAANVNSFITMLIGGLWHGASWNFVLWGGLNGIGMVINKIWRATNMHLRFWVLAAITAGVIIVRLHYPTPFWRVAAIWITIMCAGCFIQYMWFVLKLKDNFVSKSAGTIWAVLQTFVFITFTRLFFRSGSNLDPATANKTAWETATNMLNQIGGAWDNTIILPFVWEYRNVVLLFVIGMLVHWLPDKFKQWYRLSFASLPLWAIGTIAVLTVIILYQFVSADMQPFIYFQF